MTIPEDETEGGKSERGNLRGEWCREAQRRASHVV